MANTFVALSPEGQPVLLGIQRSILEVPEPKLVIVYVLRSENFLTFTEKILQAVYDAAFGLDSSREEFTERRVASLRAVWDDGFESSIRNADGLWACLRMMQSRCWKDRFCVRLANM